MQVLADGWRLPLWVVGANRVRSVDESWPEVGSRVEHSMGSWPVLIADTTTVIVFDRTGYLRVTADARGIGTFELAITVRSIPTGCRVTLTEDAVSGPASLVPGVFRTLVIGLRNRESAKRLALLAEGALRERATTPSSPGRTDTASVTPTEKGTEQ